MKKILAIALLLVLVASVFVVASTAADEPTYWSISSDCLVKAKEIIVNNKVTVPTFKAVDDSADVDGLLVGIPTYATYEGKFFQEIDDSYTIQYIDKDGNEINTATEHIGTTDKVVVYKNGVKAATYGLVTYGDADGDGYFDVLDAAIASLCLNNLMAQEDNPAVYEAVKAFAGFDNDEVVVEDYSQIVNDAISGDIEENLKGRKTPIDETLSFESVIYANTGATRTAAVTANDSNFLKECNVTINYNNSSTAPSASGIYSVTAYVPESETYLVTPGTRALGYIVIAPQSTADYGIAVDNTNKKITVSVINANAANTTLSAEFEKWLNASYDLTIGDTKNPSTVASALPKRAFEVYTGQATTLVKTENEEVLGSYLPDDETLWANSEASNSKTVTVAKDTSFSYDVVFKQDSATINDAKATFLKTQASGGRGQRNSSNAAAFVYGKIRNNMPSVRVAILDVDANCATNLGSTGLKTLLVGYVDTIAIEASKTTDFSSADRHSLFKEASLFDKTDVGKRLSTYSSKTDLAAYCLPTVNKVLKAMGMKSVGLSTTLGAYENSVGYCNYICVSSAKGLRYNVVYYLEFVLYDETEDAHRILTYDSNVTMVEPAKNFDRMAGGEPIVVTPKSGYKVKITDANGNEIPFDSRGYYLMPYTDVNITAVAE